MQRPDPVPHVPEKSYGGARGMRPIDAVQLDEPVWGNPCVAKIHILDIAHANLPSADLA
jgi:hypothetical protein